METKFSYDGQKIYLERSGQHPGKWFLTRASLCWTTAGFSWGDPIIYFDSKEEALEAASKIGRPPMTIEELEYLEVEGW